MTSGEELGDEVPLKPSTKFSESGAMLNFVVVSLILTFALALGVAKRRRRKSKGFQAVRINQAVTVGALADGALISSVCPDVVTTEKWAIATKLMVSMRDHTAGEGPLIVGLAHNDYSDAEMLEWHGATGSWDTSDKIAQEQARRKCRNIGEFSGLNTEEVLNDGRPIKTKLKFRIEEGKTLDFFVINESGAQLTTGTVVRLTGWLYLKDI